MAYDPQSYRIRIYSAVEKLDEYGFPHTTYPKLLWEEPPGRELTMELANRFALVGIEAEEFRRLERSRVCIALAFLFEQDRVDYLYTDGTWAPQVQFVPKAAVWVKVPQAVRS